MHIGLASLVRHTRAAMRAGKFFQSLGSKSSHTFHTKYRQQPQHSGAGHPTWFSVRPDPVATASLKTDVTASALIPLRLFCSMCVMAIATRCMAVFRLSCLLLCRICSTSFVDTNGSQRGDTTLKNNI